MEKQDRKNVIVEVFVQPVPTAQPLVEGLTSDAVLTVPRCPHIVNWMRFQP